MKHYDVIVAGGGHAGCEAALAAARLGASTLLVTINMDHIGQMSCNPAIGGIAKGQVVREIDALGGFQGVVTDDASIQFRMLNRGKGPAVWSPRAQCDKVVYQRNLKLLLELTPGLDVIQSEAISFLVENDRITGITNQFGDRIHCSSLVLATGTFLRGKLHYGLRNFPGGRAGDPPSLLLAEAIDQVLGLRIGRLKTGTPPRIVAKTIDFKEMRLQESEEGGERFSHWSRELSPPLPEAEKHDLPCYQVYSTDETAAIVRANLDQSPMYQGVIKGIGARYCPSFEDKIVRFPQHPRHQIYLEPEGVHTGEYYINGISSSLPPEVQRAMIHSIPGLEKAVLSRYAYAIEYDFIQPDQLERSLKLKPYRNLFSAGQINGTSGYEEAAGQGLVAGLNAARLAAGKAPVELGRDSSYIGVMIDDLVTKEILEPYRLFTSRAEYRLRLRQDNADLRLSEFAWQHGLLPEPKYREFTAFRDALAAAQLHTQQRQHGGRSLFRHLSELSPEAPAGELPFPAELLPPLPRGRMGERVWRELLIEAKYEGYLAREEKEIAKLHRLEHLAIPEGFDFDMIPGLGNESRAKLNKIRPTTVAQAGRIDGVTPADIALLQVSLIRRQPQMEDAEE